MILHTKKLNFPKPQKNVFNIPIWFSYHRDWRTWLFGPRLWNHS